MLTRNPLLSDPGMRDRDLASVVITTPEGRTIEVTLVEARGGDKVRLGVTADREVIVHRKERLRRAAE